MDIYEILALFAGGLVVANTVPQLLKIMKTKKVEDLSIMMFLMLFLAQTIWTFYAIHIHNVPVLLTNVGSLVVVSANIAFILKYRKVPVNN